MLTFYGTLLLLPMEHQYLKYTNVEHMSSKQGF